MNFHQFQLTFDALQDRILMRISFRVADQQFHEIRAWLSRHMVRNLWPNVLQALEARVAMEQPGMAHIKADIVGMEHQASLSRLNASGNFSTTFEAVASHFPLGENPILLSKIEFTISHGEPLRVSFQAQEGQGFELKFTPSILHGFCNMLQTTVARADWDYELELPGFEEQQDGQRLLN